MEQPVKNSGNQANAGNRGSISVVIPAYGQSPFLPAVVDAVLAQSLQPLEIIVAHSGSHDPTDELQAKDPRVRVLHFEDRLLAGAARNAGLAEATSDFVAFLDADVLPIEGWLRAHGAAAGGTRFVIGSVGYEVSGGYWGLSLWATEFSSVLPGRPEGETLACASANMLVPAEAVRRVGGFPTAFQPGEDVILAAELRKAGLTQWFSGAAEVRHFNLYGLRNCLSHLYRLGYRSAMCRHWYPLPGHQAIRFPPLVLGLWVARVFLTYRRFLAWGRGHRLLALALAPGVVVALIAWNLGFFAGQRVSWEDEPPIGRASGDFGQRGPAPQ